MKRYLVGSMLTAAACLMGNGTVEGRGFGGFRAGGFSAGGFSGGGYRSAGASSFGGYRSFGGASGESFSGLRGSYSGSRDVSGYSGWRSGGASSSYDRSWSGDRGGSVDVSGSRSAARGPFGGGAAGSTRDVTATTPGGRTYSSSSARGVAVGPYGRTVGGSVGTRTASGPRGTASNSWESAFRGTRFPTDFGGLSHYSRVGVAGMGHSTAYWSRSYTTARAGVVRTNFGYYNCFRPAWYTAHPGCWYAAGWAAGAAWRAATWNDLASFCAIPAQPVDYDYGSNVVYQQNNVYVNGTDVGTAQQYAQQATDLADAGQKAPAPAEDKWQPLGVFALVQGDEKTSNNIFQLAVDGNGVIRGNYYDGLLDSTAPVYGSVDKKTQRAAWTIGKKNDRVFETGIYNLTKAETAVLVHLGTGSTQQWMLVRMEQPQSPGTSAKND